MVITFLEDFTKGEKLDDVKKGPVEAKERWDLNDLCCINCVCELGVEPVKGTVSDANRRTSAKKDVV